MCYQYFRLITTPKIPTKGGMVMRYLKSICASIRNVGSFLNFMFQLMPGTIIALLIFEVVYWTSPEWAQNIGHPTWEKTKQMDAERAEAMSSLKIGRPVDVQDLPEWIPLRVEQNFSSGLSVVSALGPHENFQYIVGDLKMKQGTTFRLFQGKMVEI